MYLGIDIGGTKTLVAALTDNGEISESIKFPTPHIYAEFLEELDKTVKTLKHNDFKAATIAVPGRLDREKGIVHDLGNLAWHNQPIRDDCQDFLHCPVLIENDAKLAGLSEAMLHPDVELVLYVTVSTGIGTGFVTNRRLDPGMQNSEGGHMLLPYKGKLTEWEHFASGKALYERYNRKAADIPASEETIWKEVAHNLALGFYELIAVIEPQMIVIGGSIGTYFDRYSHFLHDELKKHEVPMVPLPKIVQAKRPEVAVIFGCYDLAKQVYAS